MFNVNLKQIQQKFKDCGFYFQLTGSRYFANPHEESDFDYIVQDNPVVREFLESLGFTTTVNDHYNDTNTVRVYTYQYGDKAWEKIDVQCCENFEIKYYAQQLIRRCFPKGLPKDKDFSKGIWELAIRVAEFSVRTSKPVTPQSTIEDKANRLKDAWIKK